MFNCCKKRKTKIEPKTRTDSYSDFLDICIKDWQVNNKNLNIFKIAPKPPTPISSMKSYINKKNKKNEK